MCDRSDQIRVVVIGRWSPGELAGGRIVQGGMGVERVERGRGREGEKGGERESRREGERKRYAERERERESRREGSRKRERFTQIDRDRDSQTN